MRRDAFPFWALGAVLVALSVGFGIVAVFFVQDVIVAHRLCVGTTAVELVLCQISAQQARARLPWEVVGLLIIGATIGAARALRH